MATTIKEKGSASAGDGMEKKMKKTNSPNPQQPKKTPTKSSSSDQKPEKPLPNYLKPTISSSLDFSSSRTSRRSTTDPKPATTNRRHPVEKPPLLAHHTHKAQSAKPAPQRSFSSLSSNKTIKTGAGPTMMRRSLSAKGATSSKAVTKTGSKNVAQPESSAELEPQINNKDLVEIPSDCDVLETPSQEEPLVDSSVVMKEEEVHDEVVVVEKAEEGEQDEEEAQEQDQAPHEEINEEEKSIDKEEEEGIELEDHVDEEKETEEINEEKDVAVELERESGEGSKEGGKEKKNESPAKQTQSGKEAQVYNDVIEETASKLMEDNSGNKVKALAGAFETVISLQDTK